MGKTDPSTILFLHNKKFKRVVVSFTPFYLQFVHFLEKKHDLGEKRYRELRTEYFIYSLSSGAGLSVQGMPSRWSCLHPSVCLLVVGWCGKLAALFKATWNSCCQALLEIDLMWWLNNWSECGLGYKWTWTGSCLLKKLLHLSSIRNHWSASKFTLSLLSLLRSWGKNTCI